MAIRSFSVGPMRSLVRAVGDHLGNLVVLAGPNGAGKSSLLELLRQQRNVIAEPGTEVMFVGPHRTWRATRLNQMAVYGLAVPSFRELLKKDMLPQFQYYVPPGMQWIQGGSRETSSADDAQALVKASLVKLRDKQQKLVAAAWKEQGSRISEGTVPDLFEPFTRLIETLLPHLEWVGINDSDTENITCDFRRKDMDEKFDIDQLSSGEKAAVALLLPFVEGQAELLATPPEIQPGVVPLTMLLDEPEIHLHPLLQLQVLNYLRTLAKEDSAQFIIATQSPTLLDALEEDELYLVSPASLRPDNQLSRLTTSQERLETARSLTGSTHLLTRAKPIVFIEGETERQRITSDNQLVKLLLPELRSWAVVAGRSKNDVTTAVRQLRQEGIELPGSPVFGVVDRDTSSKTLEDHVVPWSVAMIENLLLEPEAIYDVLRPHGQVTGASSVSTVSTILGQVVEDQIENEIRIRVQRQLPIGRLEARPDRADALDEIASEQTAAWVEKLKRLDIPAMIAEERAKVESIRSSASELEHFHGKRVLRALHSALGVQNAGISHRAFALAIADRVAEGNRVKKLAGPAILKIKYYFPADLANLLRTAGLDPTTTEEVSKECTAHRTAWEAGQPDPSQRESIRARVFSLAQTATPELRAQITRLASEIGTE